ncbi:MAG: PqqD family protein [Bacteroidetes bacterium]|jgi:hypothetical protein|nr:PqqD family protein [Bacteroidota bacterium]
MARTTYNLLDLTPVRAREWVEEDGRVVVLMPKFRHRWMAPWLQPLLRKPNVRVKLDDLGSAVWRLCDGTTPVARMAEVIQAQFGGNAEPVLERIGAFLRKLEDGDLLTIPPPPTVSTTESKKEN